MGPRLASFVRDPEGTTWKVPGHVSQAIGVASETGALGPAPPLLSFPDGCVFAANLIQTVLLPQTLGWVGLGWASFRAFCFCISHSTSHIGLLDSSSRALLLCLPTLCLISPR